MSGPKKNPRAAEKALIETMNHPDVLASSVHLVEKPVEGIGTTDTPLVEFRNQTLTTENLT